MDGMSQREFQNYLGLLGRLLRLRTTQRKAIEEELRAHMEERFAVLCSQGIEPEQAVSMALAEFGDAAALAAEFTAIARLQKRRWMMRFTIGSIAATILLSAAVISMWPDGSGQLAEPAAQAQQAEKPAPPKAPEPALPKVEELAPAKPQQPALPKVEEPAPRQDANARTQAKLETHTDAEFKDTPLMTVLDYLAGKTGVQVYVDRRALDEVGQTVDKDVVTINLKDVPAEMILRLALRQHGLAYMLDHGVVVVSTREEMQNSLEIRVYRVSDLLEKPGEEKAEAYAPLSPKAPSPTVPGPGQPGPVGRLSRQGEMGTLIDLITATVEPNSWDQVGGPGTVYPYRGTLVIAQTYQVHRKVEKLLQELRAAIEKPPAPVPISETAPK